MGDPCETKACSRCGAVQPLHNFAAASWCRDGRRGVCKACRQVGGTRKGVTQKACTGCGQVKAVASFQKRSATPDGYHTRCRECRNTYRRARYLEDRESIQTSVRAWRAANPEKTREAARRWAQENPDKRREYGNRRRARMLSATVGQVDLDALWTGACALCDAPIDAGVASPDPLSKSLDHIVPLRLGGSHEQSNLQWTHLRCNIRKGARLSG